MAVFDGLSFSQGNQRFDYRVEVAGAEAESVESKPDAGVSALNTTSRRRRTANPCG